MHKHFPDAYRLLKELDDAIEKAGVDPIQLGLIKTRGSQINGCAFCLDKHIADAIKAGEDPRRFFVLSAWREAPNWFTEEEKLILRLTEEITDIKLQGVSDEVYNRGAELFGETKFAHIMVAAVSINAWNRIGIGLKMEPAR